MARRAHGDGSVFYDASRGKWVAVVEAGRNPETGKRVRRKATAPTKTAAKDKLDELRDELRKTGTVAPRDVTVAQVVQEWVDHPPSSMRSPITLRLAREQGRRIIASLGTVPITRLTPRQVEAMLRGMAREGLATSTIVQVRSVLVRAIRRAMRDGLVARNVAELAETPTGTRRQSRSMTRAQIAALLNEPMRPWWRAHLLVAIGCGLRPGELLGLAWQDIDFDAGTLSVRQALHEDTDAAGHYVLKLAELKTASSRRTLVMPAATAAALRVHKADQAARRLKAGSRWTDHGLVFAGPTGGPLWSEGVRAGFRRLCKRAGLGTDWHPHEQRHTFVSVLSDAGETIERIAAAAGHKSSAITKAVYWHAINPEIETAAAAMNDVLDTQPEDPS